MLLIRHNILMPPFDDYEGLSAAALDDLASGRVSPAIAPLPDQLPWEGDIEEKLKSAAYFVCSTSARTQGTCRALMARYDLDKKIIIDEGLDEIFFVPSKLMASPTENPLAAVRARLYTRLLEGGVGVESGDFLKGRINNLIQRYKSEDCIFFSHGFLMRLMRSMDLHNYDFASSLENISKVLLVEYLGHRKLQNVSRETSLLSL